MTDTVLLPTAGAAGAFKGPCMRNCRSPEATVERTMMKIGVIGVGTIARAMVAGILQHDHGDVRFVLSPRNASVTQGLAAKYPQSVWVATSNQDVLDASDVIIVSVRPDVSGAVLGALTFRPDHAVVSVIAGLSREAVLARVCPAGSVTLGIPLPAMSRGAAITVLWAARPDVAALFRRAGPVVEAESFAAFISFAAVTAMMGTQYKLWDIATQWLMRHQVAAADAAAYVLSLVSGLVANAAQDPSAGFRDLEAEVALPGSYNQRFRDQLGTQGVFTAVDEALDEALTRMTAFSKP